MPDQFSLSNVVFTAPAINYALFKEKLIPNDACIGAFRIFAMSDDYERRDPLVKMAPLLYPHSLLYLVSGLFEDRPDSPLIGLARHLQGVHDADVQAFLDIFQGAAFDPVVYAVTPAGTPTGERAGFTSHYGSPGPNFDRATLNSEANQIRPPSPTDLIELAVAPPEQDDALEPVAMVILDDARREGRLSSDELVEAEREVFAEAAEIEAQSPPPILEQLIGTNDIVDHALVDVLVRNGHAVARIVTMGMSDMATIPPEERANAWAQAQRTGHIKEGYYGTGWILGRARRVLVTNNHVLPLPEAARTATVEFGYQRTPHHLPQPELTMRLRPDRLFITDPNMSFGGLDYSVIALRRPAPAEMGYLDPVQGFTANTARNIFIVQHPGGGKAYVLNHNYKVNLPDRCVTYISDTLEGSSGSPLFNGDGDLVGIHHLGNYVVKVGGKEEITNLGSRIELVIDDIARRLREETDMDEAQVIHWFGEESSVLRAWRRLG